MDQGKKQNTQTQDPNRQGQQHIQPGQGQHDKDKNKDQDQRHQPGSNPEHDGQKERKTA